VAVQLKPETEQLVQEEIRSGHFHSVDELIVQGVRAWREKHRVSQPSQPPVKQSRPQGKKSLARLFAESPFKGLSMDFERFSDTLPPADL
jgi:Arc/MetJ-type ribon-helix-helix transcriptional regulator